MTTFDAVQFARNSAAMAIDQSDEYADSIGSFRENVIDTMAEYRVTDEIVYQAALDAYDAGIVAALANA